MTAIIGPGRKAQELGLTNIRATADGVVGEIGEYSVGIRELSEYRLALDAWHRIKERIIAGTQGWHPDEIEATFDDLHDIHRALERGCRQPQTED